MKPSVCPNIVPPILKMFKQKQLYALAPRVDSIKIIVNALKVGKNALVFVDV